MRRPLRRCDTARHEQPSIARTSLAAPARCRAPSADVLRRLQQLAAGHGLVGRVAGIGPLARRAADAPARSLRRLAARLHHAVPGAAELLLRFPADDLPEVDGSAGVRALALRTRGR